MTYNELLTQEPWYEKCIEILHRDQYRCQKCGALGYHNNAFYECQTADDLDRFLEGLLIKDEKPSVFIDRNRESINILNVNICLKENTKSQTSHFVRDKYLCDLFILEDPFDILGFDLLAASKSRMQYIECKSFILIDREDVKIPLETYLKCLTGCFYVFDNSYFDNYVVRIEKREMKNYSAVIACICYKDCGLSLEFSVDTEGNYLKAPIIPKALNVHHRYYIDGKNPWEYDNDALITLCQDCHCDVHKSIRTPVYKELCNKQILRYAEICSKCSGSGFLPQYYYRDNGICYDCHGEGVIVDPRDIDRYLLKHGQTSINS